MLLSNYLLCSALILGREYGIASAKASVNFAHEKAMSSAAMQSEAVSSRAISHPRRLVCCFVAVWKSAPLFVLSNTIKKRAKCMSGFSPSADDVRVVQGIIAMLLCTCHSFITDVTAS